MAANSFQISMEAEEDACGLSRSFFNKLPPSLLFQTEMHPVVDVEVRNLTLRCGMSVFPLYSLWNHYFSGPSSSLDANFFYPLIELLQPWSPWTQCLLFCLFFSFRYLVIAFNSHGDNLV